MLHRILPRATALAALLGFVALGWHAARPGASQTVATVEAPVAMPDSWLQFRLNDAHNPVIDSPNSVAWHIETHGQISASPAIVNGNVYVGTNGGTLYAIDVATGKIRWKYRAHNGLKSNPLV